MNPIAFVRELVATSITNTPELGQLDPWDVVALIPIPDAGTAYDQAEVAKQAALLDHRNCLGRLASIAHLFEQRFPDTTITYGEVTSDHLRELLLANVMSWQHDESYLHEILMYEEPHGIPVMDDCQYEPLSVVAGWDIKHPGINQLPLWESIAAAWQVSVANLQTDPRRTLGMLLLAKALQPSLLLVDQNLAATLYVLGYTADAIRISRECFEKRPTARTAFFLHCLTSEPCWRDWMDRTYGLGMFNLIGREVM